MSLFDTLNAAACTSWYQLHSSAVNIITQTSGDISGTLNSIFLTNRQLCGNFINSVHIDNIDMIQSQDFTIFIWLLQTITPESGYTNTIYESSDLTADSYIRIEINSSNQITVIIKNGVNNNSLVYTSPITNNVWYNIAITHTVNNITLYVNGISAITGSSFELDIVYQTLNSIGCQAINKSNPFTGYLKNLFLFGNILTIKQIQKFYYLTYINN